VALVLLVAPTCEELESQGQSAIVDYAVGAVNAVFPAATAAAVVNVTNHAWGIDPFSMCTWAIAKPGGSPGRLTLAAPIDNKIFLAGEALSLNSATSLLGAYESGQVSADLALLALANSNELGSDDVLTTYAKLGIDSQGAARP
jgi:monoamine oxidase